MRTVAGAMVVRFLNLSALRYVFVAHRGKWTPEEESYANRLIVEFKAGLLPLTDGRLRYATSIRVAFARTDGRTPLR